MAAGEGRVEAETSKRLGGAAPDVTAISDTCGRGNRGGPLTVQECPAHKKPPPPRTLQWAYAWGPTVVLGGGQFLMSEVLLYPPGGVEHAAKGVPPLILKYI